MSKPFNYCFRQEANDNYKLYIYDDVTAYGGFDWTTWEYKESETSAKYFRDQLAEIPETATIELHINSNGGSVKEGVAIYNQLKQKDCKKVGYVDGVAYSIAFVILQACDERIMGVGTSALIHEMWVDACGNAKQLRKMADDLDILMEANRKIFLERSNLTEDSLMEMMEAETFLTPDQCLEYGLIDEIGEYRKAEEEGKAIEEAKEHLKELGMLIHQQRCFRQELETLHLSFPAKKTTRKLMNFLSQV